MTSSSPPAPPPAAELCARDQRCLAEALSEFQQGEPEATPPELPAVLAALSPLFDAGCCWSASFWTGELEVALRYGSAEYTSHHTAPLIGYSTTAARMLAGLAGLPLLEPQPIEVVQTTEPWNDPDQPPVVAPVVICPPPEPAPAPAAAPAPAPALVPAAPAPAPAAAPAPAPAVEDPELTAAELEVAASMIRDMSPVRRREFSQAFRQAFAVPADAKQVRPYITHRRHLEFCDRYTVEAAGGIAP